MDTSATTPLPEEIEAAQKAYQRILAFDRNGTPWRPYNFIIFALLLLFGTYPQIQQGNYWPSIMLAVVLLISAAQYLQQRRQKKLDLAYLALLKRVYGESVYAEVQKPPRSVYYYVFQKRYWPDRRPVSVALP